MLEAILSLDCSNLSDNSFLKFFGLNLDSPFGLNLNGFLLTLWLSVIGNTAVAVAVASSCSRGLLSFPITLLPMAGWGSFCAARAEETWNKKQFHILDIDCGLVTTLTKMRMLAHHCMLRMLYPE